MSLLALATMIVLGVSGDIPEYVVEPNTTHGLLVEAEAHPAEIDVQSILPAGQTIPVMNCVAENTCAVKVTFPQCGLYQFPGVIRYAFLEPGDTGPYIIGVNAAVIVAGCDIFADGFENGTTDAWSKTEGG